MSERMTRAPEAQAPDGPTGPSHTPWKIGPRGGEHGGHFIDDAEEGEVFVAVAKTDARCRANVAMTVRSVNALPLLVQQLRACAARFREYQAHHEATGAPDKAARNQVMAAECDKAIAIAEGRA